MSKKYEYSKHQERRYMCLCVNVSVDCKRIKIRFSKILVIVVDKICTSEFLKNTRILLKFWRQSNFFSVISDLIVILEEKSALVVCNFDNRREKSCHLLLGKSKVKSLISFSPSVLVLKNCTVFWVNSVTTICFDWTMNFAVSQWHSGTLSVMQV